MALDASGWPLGPARPAHAADQGSGDTRPVPPGAVGPPAPASPTPPTPPAPAPPPGPPPGADPASAQQRPDADGSAAQVVEALAAARDSLGALAGLPLPEHVARYDAVHATLQDALAAIDGV